MSTLSVKGPPSLTPNPCCLAMCVISNLFGTPLIKTSAQLNQQHSPILRLPAELRNKIYDYAMDTNTTEKLHHDMLSWDRLHLPRICR
jgi:hypothetical protein